MEDVPTEEHRDERDAEAWLARARPEPRDDFVERLEGRLVGHRRHRRRLGALVAGLSLSGGLAAAVVVVTLAGGGPLQSGDDDARAKDDCTTEQVRTTQRESELVRGADGQARVVTVEKPVSREVTRCR